MTLLPLLSLPLLLMVGKQRKLVLMGIPFPTAHVLLMGMLGKRMLVPMLLLLDLLSLLSLPGAQTDAEIVDCLTCILYLYCQALKGGWFYLYSQAIKGGWEQTKYLLGGGPIGSSSYREILPGITLK